MSDAISMIAFCLFGYLLGSIPFGLLLTTRGRARRHPRHRLGQYRRDQRAAHRSKGLAAATLLLDALKGAAAVLIARLAGERTRIVGAASPPCSATVPGLAAIQGRQGRRDRLGVLIAASWPVGVAACAVWLLVAGTARDILAGGAGGVCHRAAAGRADPRKFRRR